MKKIFTFICFVLMFTALCGCNSKSNLDEMFEFGSMVDNTYTIKNVKSKEITSIEIPSTYQGKKIKRIGRGAFENCSKLKNATIPEGIEEIDAYAFRGCTALTNILIPNSIKEINYNAFDDCTSLNYNIYENGKYLGNNNNYYVALIAGIDKDVSSFTVNENCNVIYENALNNFSKLKTIDMHYSITYIGTNAFNGCSSLETFLVPNYIRHFDASWFSYCSSLKSITLSAGIETISIPYMFGCTSFSEFNVYSTNPRFAAKDGVLYSKDLKTLLVYPIAKTGDNFSIPSYVETVAAGAFDGNKYLKSLSMWAIIKTLRKGAVINCNSLHTVNFKGTMNEWIALDNANLGWDHSFSVNTVNCSDGSLNRGSS